MGKKGTIVFTREESSEKDNQQNLAAKQVTKAKNIKKPVTKPKIQATYTKTAIEKIAEEDEKKYEIKNQHVDGQQIQQQRQKLSSKSNANKLKKLNDKIQLKHLAICFPDSILEIPQTSPLRSYFISEVARISSIFRVDQIVILKDHGYNAKSEKFNPSEYIARNLQYLETPQYLRKHLFKLHPDLKNAGLMNPIQCHHHLKTHDICQFRQGVSLDRPTKQGAGSWVDIGLRQQARMNCMVLPGTRVTLRLKQFQNPQASFYDAQAVSKKQPRIEKNLYWGYDVRIANNFKQMLNQNNYDVKIICNHHEIINQLQNIDSFEELNLDEKSVIIFFSGTDDLSTLIERDQGAVLKTKDVINKFDYSIKFHKIGVQKLRIEQQLFITLCKLSNVIK